MATLTTPPGWYADPLARHDYRYWDGANWTPGVSDHGVTGTDAPQMRPPSEGQPSPVQPGVVDEAAVGATASTRAYRAVAVPRARVAAVQAATVAVAIAFVFEIVASVVLAGQVSSAARPSQSTLGWASWLYDADPLRIVYSYPPLGLWLALFLTSLLLSLLPLKPLQALKKAGLRATWRWSAPVERATLTRGLTELGWASTLFRTRGRRGLLIASEVAALGIVAVSAYALIAKPALIAVSGTYASTTVAEVGLGPIVCLAMGVVAVVAGLLAWPWTTEQHVLVFLDGTVRPEQPQGPGQPVQAAAVVGMAGALAQPMSEPRLEPPSAVAASAEHTGGPPPVAAPPRRSPRWLVPVLAVVAILGLLAGLLAWSPWSNDSPTTIQVTASAPSPVGLKAGPVTANSVAVQWAPGATDLRPARYLILSDGTEIGSVPGTTTTYRLTGLAPATSYQVSVIADWGDYRSLPSSALLVKTSTPAVAAARLTGTWDINVKVTKAPSGSSFKTGRASTETWTFAPQCKSGPCPVVVSGDLWSHPFTATLTRSGAVYVGTAKAHITHCGSFPLTSTNVRNTVTLRLTVMKAGVDEQAWAATALVGQLTMSSPYTRAGIYYCPVQTVKASIAANN